MAARQPCSTRSARSSGAYLPDWYAPEYLEPKHDEPHGRLRGTFPRHAGAPYRVPKRTVSDLDAWPYPKAQLVPLTETVHERY